MTHAIAQIGPPRLFDGETPAQSGVGLWVYAISLVVGVLLIFVVLRLKTLLGSDDRIAFRLLARRCGLIRREREAVERLASRSGVAPVALLISESAFSRAAAGERLSPSQSVEVKPVLLTRTDLGDLERVSARLFPEGSLQPTVRIPDENREEIPDEANRWTA